MNEIFNFLISEVFLDTYNLNIVDHIKVSHKFLKYLEANNQDVIVLEKCDEQPNGIISKYKGVPLVVDTAIDDCYKVEYKNDSWFGKFVDVTSARKDNVNKKENYND